MAFARLDGDLGHLSGSDLIGERAGVLFILESVDLYLGDVPLRVPGVLPDVHILRVSVHEEFFRTLLDQVIGIVFPGDDHRILVFILHHDLEDAVVLADLRFQVVNGFTTGHKDRFQFPAIVEEVERPIQLAENAVIEIIDLDLRQAPRAVIGVECLIVTDHEALDQAFCIVRNIAVFDQIDLGLRRCRCRSCCEAEQHRNCSEQDQ